jgi:hypothetical protein
MPDDRKLVTKRARGRCEYCHATELICSHTFHIEHIVPKKAGGKNDPSNYALACADCNLAKGSQTYGLDSKSKTTVELFNPRKHKWEKHFKWSNKCLEIVGKTEIGRTTVLALRLNGSTNKSRSEARRLWYESGYLP